MFKFMHIFIEQLYKILLIVASACLIIIIICQQFSELNYKKQGFMSCSELPGHLKQFFKKDLSIFIYIYLYFVVVSS